MSTDIDTAEKTCTTCGVEKPVDQFNRNRRGAGGLDPVCRPCTRARKAREERPTSLAAVNRSVDMAPDPEPAQRLRLELQAQRERGQSWRLAWPRAVKVTLRDLAPTEATAWRVVFVETEATWQASYTGSVAPGSPVRLAKEDELAA